MTNTRCSDRRAKQQILMLFRHITPLFEVLHSEFTSIQRSTLRGRYQSSGKLFTDGDLLRHDAVSTYILHGTQLEDDR